MPTYDYKCTSCKKIETIKHHFEDILTPECDECKIKGKDSRMRKMISSQSGIHFKGSGFYETDYKDK